ncbi:MAG: manganese efflux pump MntP [bacterium]
MTILEILTVAIALGIDCMGVAGAIALTRPSGKIVIASVLLFGIFQSLMAWIGMHTGSVLQGLVKSRIDLAGPAILIALGVIMIVKGIRSGNPSICIITYAAVVGVSITVSIDALGAGVALGISGKLSLSGIGVIGLTASVLSLIGYTAGSGLGKALNLTESTAGMMLILIAIAMIISRF